MKNGYMMVESLQAMPADPLKTFKAAHGRAEYFLKQVELVEDKQNLDSVAKDNLRATVIFAVAALDSYFKVKIISYLTKEKNKKDDFSFSKQANDFIKNGLSKRLFSVSYDELRKDKLDDETNAKFELRKDKKNNIDLAVKSGDPSLLGYLQDAMERKSFQSIEDIEEAFSIMGRSPDEIWGRFGNAMKTKNSTSRRGRPTEHKVQLIQLFKKRHYIAHNADVILFSKKNAGDERLIAYDDVQRWLKHSMETVESIDKLLKS